METTVHEVCPFYFLVAFLSLSELKDNLPLTRHVIPLRPFWARSMSTGVKGAAEKNSGREEWPQEQQRERRAVPVEASSGRADQAVGTAGKLWVFFLAPVGAPIRAGRRWTPFLWAKGTKGSASSGCDEIRKCCVCMGWDGCDEVGGLGGACWPPALGQAMARDWTDAVAYFGAVRWASEDPLKTGLLQTAS